MNSDEITEDHEKCTITLPANVDTIIVLEKEKNKKPQTTPLGHYMLADQLSRISPDHSLLSGDILLSFKG